MSARSKVFGVGFSKTGTKSLAASLTILGYSVTGPNQTYNPHIAQQYLSICNELAEQFDAFQDNPWPLVYQQMCEKYPESKFILTIRPPAEWYASILRHFGSASSPMRELVYGAGRGSPVGNEAHYIAAYHAHNDAVRNYFRDKPGRLLIFELCSGAGWSDLCNFLQVPTPQVSFPVENTAKERASNSPLCMTCSYLCTVPTCRAVMSCVVISDPCILVPQVEEVLVSQGVNRQNSFVHSFPCPSCKSLCPGHAKQLTCHKCQSF